MAERFLDALGVPFDAVKVPDKYASVKIVKDPKAQKQYKAEWDHCQICGRRGDWELHHLVGGARRSDELTNFLVLCGFGRCHELAQHSPNWAGVLLFMKWYTDTEHIVWQRLTELKGSRLPELVRDSGIIKGYKQNQGL